MSQLALIPQTLEEDLKFPYNERFPCTCTDYSDLEQKNRRTAEDRVPRGARLTGLPVGRCLLPTPSFAALAAATTRGGAVLLPPRLLLGQGHQIDLNPRTHGSKNNH